MKIRTDFSSQVVDLTWHFQYGGHDVISHRNVLPG